MIPIVLSQACVMRNTYYSYYETMVIQVVESINIHPCRGVYFFLYWLFWRYAFLNCIELKL
jgi:hypothetical protein